MAFRDVLGHTQPIEWLQRAIRNGKVGHSYLFLGNDGIGKRWVALQFAKTLNCIEGGDERGDACDQCLSCRKIDEGMHPDVLILEPENQTLKVNQVRQIQRDLAYRPYEGKRRFCILGGADRMAPNMSNILLKTLEEPPLHTILILLANNSKLLLPTILSRCQILRFSPLSVPVVSKWLVENKGLSEQEAHLAASLSEGSIGRALVLKERMEQIGREDLLTKWVRLREFPFQVIQDRVDSLPSDREDLLVVLELTKTLLRDLLIAKISEDDSRLIHSDLSKEIRVIASEQSLPSLMKRMEVLHETTLAISPMRGNANTKLALEAMMLSWSEG